ncbi:MAG: cell division protein FtsZ, partial [Gammaproteobacteria bacterium]
TRPFPFEGRKRMAIANEGVKLLKDKVDSLITVPNEKLLTVLGKDTTLLDAFKAANDVLLGAVQGIADLIIRPGMINVDFADVRTVMSEMGMAMMGSGVASGENRAREAAEAAVHSPLLEDIDLRGARGILVNITAGPNLSLGEFSDVGDTVEEFASDQATVVVGTVIDDDMGDELRVTVVATGLGRTEEVSRPVPSKVVDNTLKTNGEIDYGQLDRPTVTRTGGRGSMRGGAATAMAAEPQGEAMAKVAAHQEADMDYLDIPAFLRRQAD